MKKYIFRKINLIVSETKLRNAFPSGVTSHHLSSFSRRKKPVALNLLPVQPPNRSSSRLFISVTSVIMLLLPASSIHSVPLFFSLQVKLWLRESVKNRLLKTIIILSYTVCRMLLNWLTSRSSLYHKTSSKLSGFLDFINHLLIPIQKITRVRGNQAGIIGLVGTLFLLVTSLFLFLT